MFEYTRLKLNEVNQHIADNKGRSCVYVLHHLPTGKFYIGSSSDPRERYMRHFRELENKIHHSQKLQDVFTKREDFEIAFLWADELKEVRDVEHSLLAEHHGTDVCLNTGDSAYGAWRIVPDHIRAATSIRRKGVATTPKGVPRTEEDKLKISIATRAAVAGKPGPNLGKKLSDITKAKVAAARSKPVSVDGDVYPNGLDAAAKLGLGTSTVNRRANDPRFPTWFFCDKDGNKI